MLIAFALVAGCGGSEEPSSSMAENESPPTTAATPAENDAPRIYFTAGEQFAKVDSEYGDQARPAELVEELLDGPSAAARRNDIRTQIPAGAELEQLDVGGGTATVGLSSDFLHGISATPDDAARQDLNARIGQLTYTLTELDGVREVRVLAGGEPIEPPVERAAFARPKQGPEPIQRRRGAKSAQAREVQERLVRLHFLPAKAVDGVYGYRTEQAVLAFQAWNGLARDGVVGPQTTAALRAAKQPKPTAGGPDRRIEVYREKGVALLVKRGRTKRAIHVSSGAPGTSTPSGTYEVFRKELRSWSVPFQVWLPYASYFNNGIAFHEYADVPPYPASHGCVRVPSPEATGVYRFAKIGTTVVVL